MNFIFPTNCLIVASAVLLHIAQKDLTTRMSNGRGRDFARIKEALNTAEQNLEDAMLKVSVGSEQCASASNQISAGG